MVKYEQEHRRTRHLASHTGVDTPLHGLDHSGVAVAKVSSTHGAGKVNYLVSINVLDPDSQCPHVFHKQSCHKLSSVKPLTCDGVGAALPPALSLFRTQ